MILEAGKMMLKQGLPDRDAKYKYMLSQLVKNMVIFLPPIPVVPKSLLMVRIH